MVQSGILPAGDGDSETHWLAGRRARASVSVRDGAAGG